MKGQNKVRQPLAAADAPRRKSSGRRKPADDDDLEIDDYDRDYSPKIKVKKRAAINILLYNFIIFQERKKKRKLILMQIKNLSEESCLLNLLIKLLKFLI